MELVIQRDRLDSSTEERTAEKEDEREKKMKKEGKRGREGRRGRQRRSRKKSRNGVDRNHRFRRD